MRVRVTVLVAALMACACAVIPSIAAAHGPVRDRALTIHNSPQSIVAGDPVLIYGRLLGRDAANQRIVLWHRINPRAAVHDHRPHPDRQLGPLRVHPPERDRADQPQLVCDRPGAQSFADRPRAGLGRGDARPRAPPRRPPVTRSRSPARYPPGTPARRSRSRRSGATPTLDTIKTGRLNASSSYSIPFAWRFPGPRNVRAVFAGDPSQHPGDLGGQHRHRRADRGARLHDRLEQPDRPQPDAGLRSRERCWRHRAAHAEPGVSVALYASQPGQHNWSETQTTTTGHRRLLQLHGAGLDATSCTRRGPRLLRCAIRRSSSKASRTSSRSPPSATAAVVGQRVTFSGNVSPGKPGDCRVSGATGQGRQLAHRRELHARSGV